MKQYFLGLDGGATKTHILLYDKDSGLLDLFTGPGSNYENMPGLYDDLKIVLKQMFDTLLGKHNISPADIRYAAFGMAGVDTKKQHEEISKVISSLGFTDFVLNNDAFLGVKAGTSRGAGVSCVNGSGFSVVGIGVDNETFQTGGMGTVTGDYGGGYWFVPEAMSYVHGQFFRRYPESLMTQPVMEFLGITSPMEYMEAMHYRYFNGDGKAFNLAVCKIIFEAAEKGDAAACGLMARSARAYGENILGILDNLCFDEPVEIVLTGSLFQKYPESHMVKKLAEFLVEHYDKTVELKILDVPSVLGALFWAMGDVSPQERAMLRKKMDEIMN